MPRQAPLEDPKTQKALKHQAALLTTPRTNAQLQQWVWKVLGVWIPGEQVCEHHSTPLAAFSDAFFARYPRVVWKASRGFGGKTVMLAALSLSESILLGASSTLLGGSGEQSERVHKYLRGQEPNLPKSFWNSPNAPVWLKKKDDTVRETLLSNGGRIYALMASQKSVRGPHPQRLRGDEIDEMDQALWDAASGQPMSARGIEDQIVASSTHQNADGTMTEELRRAAENGWPVHEWCYRETLQPHGWLSPSQVERKKQQVPQHMWQTEYDLQDPVVEGRAIETACIERMFDPKLGEHRGGLGSKLTIEPPDDQGQYVTGADWGKTQDKTFIITLRTDCTPARVVAVTHLGRMPYPQMIAAYNDQVRRYSYWDASIGERIPGAACHDRTGLGTVVEDYLEVPADGVTMVGKKRSDLFSEYVVAIENDEIRSPRIDYVYREHKFCTVDDLHGRGHPPDSVVAMAMAWKAASTGSIFY